MTIKGLNELANLSRDLAKYFDDDMLRTASVIIQNTHFNIVFSSEKDFKYSDIEDNLKLLNQMAQYRKDSHCLQWFNSELSMLIHSHLMLIQELEDLKNESELNHFESQSLEQ